MSLTCEISGQSLVGTDDEIVATPSGHVCLKRLLLTKLAENGGMDPFEPIRERPLSEDQLITLTGMSSKQVPPPRPSVTSLPNLLQMLQQEYDAIMLELFDTRKELQDTRRELSQALYQNDAAVRVVARLSAERDAARQQLEQWKASTGGAAPETSAAPAANGKHELNESEPNDAEPQSKRRRVEPEDLPLSNDIPDDDLDQMVSAWEGLSKGRKASVKAATGAAPTPDDWSKYQASLDTKAWHKSTCKSITAMARSGPHIVTAGKDKQLIVYNSTSQVVQHNVASKMIATHVDILGIHDDGIVVAASTNAGHLAVFEAASSDETTMTKVGDLKLDSKKLGSIVSITLHPSRQHVFLATASGRVIICAIRKEQNAIDHISTFLYEDGDGNTVKYTSGTIHPDGLIYVAGTNQGIVHLWDIKSKVMANSLTPQDGDADAIVAVAFSENGYHVATAHQSSTVRVWDLRKQKTLATLNADGDNTLQSVSSLAFDDSGKYLAYGGVGGVHVTTVKEWGMTAQIAMDHEVSNLALYTNDSNKWMATSSVKERSIRFHGVA